jgi:iron complex transport system substrate-binding protein
MKIASLLPSATEILFAIGAGGDVVGVTHECDYPPGAATLPKLTWSSTPESDAPREIDRHVRAALHAGSSLYGLDAERLERLAPDLIVTQELCAVCAVSFGIVARAVRRLQSDPRVVSLEPRSLADVFATIAFLGEITGYRDGAAAALSDLERRVDLLRRQSGLRAARPTTLVLEWTDPPMSAGHWIPELIEIAGGSPVLANPGGDSQRLEWPAIAAADPECVIVAPCGFDLPRTQRAIAALDKVPEWLALRACRERRVLALDGNAYLSRPGPRLVDAAEIATRWYTSGAEYAG